MEEGLTEPDLEAAQQLVQLSGGDEEESEGLEHNDSQKKKTTKKEKEEEEGEEMSRAEISGRGKEEDDKHRQRKRQRFRSLVSIYKATKSTSNGPQGNRRKPKRRGKGLGD